MDNFDTLYDEVEKNRGKVDVKKSTAFMKYLNGIDSEDTFDKFINVLNGRGYGI